MAIPNTKLFLSSVLAAGGGFSLLPEATGDFSGGLNWAGSIADLNGDLLPDLIVGSASSNDKAPGAGRVFVVPGASAGGTTTLGDKLTEIIVDGIAAGDHAGASVGSIADLNNDGLAEILVGAPGQNMGTKVDAGAAYVLWGKSTAGGIDLGDPYSGTGNGVGYVLKGENAGDQAGSVVLSIADLNNDAKHLAEVVVAAPTSDAGGVDSGAVYVVWGKATDNAVLLSAATAGTAGYRIKGEAAGDLAGTAVSVVGDLNGDGRQDLLIGAPGNSAGAGAAYVVHGQAVGTQVSLATVAAGTGGFRITGQAGDGAGGSVAGIGDINGDGIADMLVGAPGSNSAYVVFGKADTNQVLLSNVAAGSGGFRILAEAAGDLAGLTVTGGQDLNHDGVADFVIGAQHQGEGGADAGAVYVVWGGGVGTVDLSLVAQGVGGAKVVGSAGSLAGSAVALADVNHDGATDLVIGSAGGGQSVSVMFDPTAWQADYNVYGTNGADTLGLGYGGLRQITEGADSIYGLGGNDSISAAGGSDLVDGGTGNDTLDGGAGDNTLAGGAGADSLVGQAGNDCLDGGAANDSMAGGAGDDTYVVNAAGDVVTEAAGEGTDTLRASIGTTLAANLENLVLTGTSLAGSGNADANVITALLGNNLLNGLGGNDTLQGAAGNDTLDGGTGADSMAGGLGHDMYLVDDAGDVVSEAAGAGNDTVQASLDWTLGANLEALVLAGTATHGTGNGAANTLVANALGNLLEGLGGNDVLTGGAGDDSLDGGTGNDSMAGGTGNDTYFVDSPTDVVTEAAGAGSDTMVASVNATLAANVETLVLAGTAHVGSGNAADNMLLGNDLGDSLYGQGGNDALTGGAGDDSLDGGTGNDSMAGGAGNDSYVVDSAADVVTEAAAGGNDTVNASVDYTLGANVEALVLTTWGHAATGNAGDNLIQAAGGTNTLAGAEGADTLLGAAGNDSLAGGAGADSMAGGAGNDSYGVNDAGDVVSEAVGGGHDVVFASLDYTLADNVEDLVLAAPGLTGTGNAGDNSLMGSTGAESLAGGAGNDSLDGGTGADTMAGGSGDDTYWIDNAGDVVLEDAAGGFDTVVVSSDWTLATNIEAVQLLGAGHALTGNAGNNQLSGNSGSDTLDGGGGDDTLLGGDGDDELVVASGRATLDGGSGNDRYLVKGGQALVEDFLGDDTIDASQATGDSRIDLSGDTLSEVEHETVTLGTGGSTAAPLDVQFLQDVTGSFADDIAMVRSLVPQIVTALQAVQSNAQFGVSTFRDKPFGSFGGVGDWVYQLGTTLAADTTALTNAYTAMVANNGADAPEAQLEALMHLALTANEIGYRANAARFVVLFTDAPFHVAGDGAAQGIATPNNGDAIIAGTPAGVGEDYPLVTQVKAALEAANIIPIFCVAGGNDAIYQGLVGQLGRGAEVTLTANSSNVVAALNAGLTTATTTLIEGAVGGEGNDTLLGNAAANTLEGKGGSDSLDGGTGADSMAGGAGDDTYVVDNAGDVVTEAAGAGRDTVRASIDWTLGANVEALVLTGGAAVGTGNALDNHITGQGGAETLGGDAGNDTLDGGLGADSMAGGTGDDLYFVSEAGDLTAENAAEGNDTVQASLDWTLADNIEALALSIAGLHGTGNALGNLITASAGNNTLEGMAGDDNLAGAGGHDSLDGGSGADSMAGGAGDDTYVVDNAGDAVTEAAAAGNDTVLASVDYTLGANLEALMLNGLSLAGTGNALANAMTGGTGNDTLSGLDGSDTLDGGAGADSLLGGNGDDLYIVGLGDSIGEASRTGGIDTVQASVDWTLGLNLETLVLTGTALNGTGNTLANTLVGNDLGDNLNGSSGNDTLLGGAGNDMMNGGLGADSMAGGGGNDTYLVDNAGDQVLELAGGGLDTVKASVTFTLSGEVEALTLSGTAAINGFGNALANSLTGNAAANLLDGGAGADTITGGAGGDTLVGGLGADRLSGGLGNDAFRFGNAAEGGDRLLDFATGQDWLEVSAAGFGGGLAAGMDVGAAGCFVVGTRATAAHGQFIYAGTSLYWDADGNGAGAKVLLASVTGLVASDLHVIG